jgi:hypothetical protein
MTWAFALPQLVEKGAAWDPLAGDSCENPGAQAAPRQRIAAARTGNANTFQLRFALGIRFMIILCFLLSLKCLNP